MGSLRELGRLAYESKGGRLTTRSVESGVALTRPCGLCARELIKSTEDAGISSISRIISRFRCRVIPQKGARYAKKADVGCVVECRDHGHGPFSCKPRVGDPGQRVHKYAPCPRPIRPVQYL